MDGTLEEDIKKALNDILDANSAAVAPGITAVKWLIRYLADNGHAAAMLAHIEQEEWTGYKPDHQEFLDQMRKAIISDLQTAAGKKQS